MLGFGYHYGWPVVSSLKTKTPQTLGVLFFQAQCPVSAQSLFSEHWRGKKRSKHVCEPTGPRGEGILKVRATGEQGFFELEADVDTMPS